LTHSEPYNTIHILTSYVFKVCFSNSTSSYAKSETLTIILYAYLAPSHACYLLPYLIIVLICSEKITKLLIKHYSPSQYFQVEKCLYKYCSAFGCTLYDDFYHSTCFLQRTWSKVLIKLTVIMMMCILGLKQD